MRQVRRRLAADWVDDWRPPLALVETFVDPQLHQGPTHQASGWSHVGQTADWKRVAAAAHAKHHAPEQIWLREPVKHARVKLRAPQLQPDSAMVIDQVRLRGAETAKNPQSLIASLGQHFPEFRGTLARGYPVAGRVATVMMAVATSMRQGPDDLAESADMLSQAPTAHPGLPEVLAAYPGGGGPRIGVGVRKLQPQAALHAPKPGGEAVK